MRPSTVFLTGSVLALVFGLGFLLVPASILPLYGVSTDPSAVLMARYFGAALLHLGLLVYLLRNVREPGVVRIMAQTGVLGSIAGAAVSLMGVMAGTVNALGWSSVAIYALLVAGYAACLRPRSL
jgi:hypothetical protein